MKLIGFVKEYNNLKSAIPLEELIVSGSVDTPNLDKILEYLSQGELLLAWMGYFIDVRSNELIAPDSYFTDGVWVWPAYFPYYLNKYSNIKLSDEFLNYLKLKNYSFCLPDNFVQRKQEYEKQLSHILKHA